MPVLRNGLERFVLHFGGAIPINATISHSKARWPHVASSVVRFWVAVASASIGLSDICRFSKKRCLSAMYVRELGNDSDCI